MCSRSLDVDPRHKQNVEHIFENFVIVASSDYIYQHIPVSEKLNKEIPKFCFPFVSERYGDAPIVIDDRDTFTFVLTEESGVQQFGYCRHIKESSGSVAVICLCLLSYLPDVQFFDQVLDALIDFWELSLDKVRLLLDGLKATSVPKAAQTITLQAKGETCVFQYPDNRELPSIPANPYLNTVLTKLTPQSALTLFASLLYERRIVLASSRLSVLTATCHAFTMLLYPLHWQHIFIPVLPESLLDYLSAPMPFLVGVHSSLVPKVRALRLEEVVFCDLDRKEVCSWTNDLETLPPVLVAVLEASLRRPSTGIRTNFAQIFLDLFLYFFGNYRDFIVPAKPTDSPSPRPGGRERPSLDFDRQAFFQCSHADLRPFLEQFLELQMFHQFLDYRFDLMSKVSADSTDRILSFNVDSFTGRTILPLWWVYDCLFEYERDVKGSKGTDIESERVAYLKSKVATTVKQSRDRLKPKLAEYSSKMRSTLDRALDKVDSFNDSSAETSPQPQRNNIQEKSQSRIGRAMSLFGGSNSGSQHLSVPTTTADGGVPPPRPKPPEHYRPSAPSRSGSVGSLSIRSIEEGHDPYSQSGSRSDTPVAEGALLDLSSPAAKQRTHNTRLPADQLLIEFDSPEVKASTKGGGATLRPSVSPSSLDPFGDNVLPPTNQRAAPQQTSSASDSLLNWTDFKSAMPSINQYSNSQLPKPASPAPILQPHQPNPTAHSTQSKAVPPSRPALPPRRDSAGSLKSAIPAYNVPAQPQVPAGLRQPGRGRSASANTLAQSLGMTPSTPADMPTIPPRPLSYTPYSEIQHPADSRRPSSKTPSTPPLHTSHSLGVGSSQRTQPHAYHSIHVQMRPALDASVTATQAAPAPKVMPPPKPNPHRASTMATPTTWIPTANQAQPPALGRPPGYNAALPKPAYTRQGSLGAKPESSGPHRRGSPGSASTDLSELNPFQR